MLFSIKSIKNYIGPLLGPPGTGTCPPAIQQLGFDDPDAVKAELARWVLEDDTFNEFGRYLEQDFLRFVYTAYLVPNNKGHLLELGACPYFTTRLLKWFRNYELELANYPGSPDGKENLHRTFRKGDNQQEEFTFKAFNVEHDAFPYESGYFDVVLFCEILEHLIHDPVHTIYEMNRVLKPHGILILTTPNVNRFENFRKLLLGENIYDQYSGYGPYGRHNREYTLGEVQHLLTLHGFEIEMCFTADVKPYLRDRKHDALDRLLKMATRRRQYDLGEYIFVKARKTETCIKKRSWIFYKSRDDIVREY